MIRPADRRYAAVFDLISVVGVKLHDGARLLSELPSATNRIDLAERMKQTEHDLDEAVHAVADHLTRCFAAPQPVEELLVLVNTLDDAMDAMEQAVAYVNVLHIDDLPASIDAMIDVLTRMAALTQDALPKLRSPRSLADYWIEINRLQNDGDQIHRAMLTDLFNGTVDTLSVIKIKTVLDTLSECATAFERAAGQIERFAAMEG